MRIATWNVNSIRSRVERVIGFLERSEVDVLALQELKCKPEQFPFEPFKAAGYEVEMFGLDQWNGVAVCSRVPITRVERGFSGQPTWKGVVEARALGVTVQRPGEPELTVWSLYVPHGRDLEDPHYDYKLRWLRALRGEADEWLREDPSRQVALVGDWNVAPTDVDVWDITAFEGKTHVSPAERAAFNSFVDAGYAEVTYPLVTNYTYWDYQRLRFPRNEGMRIDFVYASAALAARVTGAEIDRDERKGKGASDHVPVIVDLGS